MSDESEQILGEYVAGKIHDVLITVRWLESEYDSEDEYDHNFVHLRLEVWSGDEGTLDLPDHWQIDWVHYVGVIADGFERFLNDYCPFPDAIEDIWETAAKVPLPPELKELFPMRERTTERVNRHTISEMVEARLAELKDAGEVESE